MVQISGIMFISTAEPPVREALLINILQIVFAVCVGFLPVFIFHRTGSLPACIGFHSLNNSLSTFASEEYLINAVGSEETAGMIIAGAKIVITAIYMIYVIKLPKRQLTSDSTQ